MKIDFINKAGERGFFDHGWLKTYHTFSFGEYYNPDKTGYSAIRVINDDLIRAKSGFPMHGHQDMEIITYVLSGTVTHKDSLGSIGKISANQIQIMHAGSGIRHSEYNEENTDLHLLQIWIVPNIKGVAPGYTTITNLTENKLNLVASGSALGDKRIYQDIDVMVYFGEESFEIDADVYKSVFIHIGSGAILINNQQFYTGDSFSFETNTKIEILPSSKAQMVVFGIY